ncbi:MAG: 6-pyruvoyl-tetrahydropterin synthase-related protein [Anaerolineales bacterium]
MMRDGDSVAASQESAGGIDPYLLLALLFSLLAALPLLMGQGIVNTRAGGDSPFLLQRVHQLSENLRAGVFPARWMPHGAHGLSYPAFNFYAALPYYIASLFDLSGFGILWGIKLTQTLGFLGAGLMMYLLARRLGVGGAGALLGSAVYTFAPFHLVNVYMRGDALSEFYAFALFPLLIWALLGVCRDPSYRSVALLAVAYASLMLTHNISALLFSPVLGLWLLAESLARGGRGGWRILAAGAGALGLGLALSAWFWIPALHETSLVQLGEQTSGYFHYAGHFRGADLVQRTMIHDYTIVERSDPFDMGLVQAIVGCLGLVALALRVAQRRKILPSFFLAAFVLLLCTWLMTSSSRWIWDHVPLLPYVQFPWRLLSIQAFGIALLASQLPALLSGRRATALGVLLASLAAVVALVGLRVDHLPLSEQDVTPQRLMLYETYSGNIGGTVRHEYLPRGMVPRPFTSAVQLNGGRKPPPLVLEGKLTGAGLLEHHPHMEVWAVDVEKKVLLAFHTTYYPGWEAMVDGTPQGVEPLAGLGLVGLRLSPGSHRVMLRFEPTPTRRYAAWLSLAGLCFLLPLVLYPAFRSPMYRRGLFIAIGCAAALIAWIVLGPPVSRQGRLAGPLVMDFARAPYLHPEPEGVWLGEAHLRDYSLASRWLHPGDDLEIEFDWERPCPDVRMQVELVSAVAHLTGPGPVWASASTPIADATSSLRLSLPEEIPPGLYVLRLKASMDGEEQPLLTAAGREMERLALAPVEVEGGRSASGEEEVLGTFGPEREPSVISLLEAIPYRLDEDMLEVRLTWRSERQAPLNYALSLRLYNMEGERIASRDVTLSPNYPTSLWAPGHLITNRVLLNMPPDEEEVDLDSMEVVLYDRLTLKGAGTVTVSAPTNLRLKMPPERFTRERSP